MTNLEWIDIHETHVKHSSSLDLPSCRVSRLHLIHNTFSDWKVVTFKQIFINFRYKWPTWSKSIFMKLSGNIWFYTIYYPAKFHVSSLLLTPSIWTNTAKKTVFFSTSVRFPANSVRTVGRKNSEYSLKPSQDIYASNDIWFVRFHQNLKEEISNKQTDRQTDGQTSLFYYYID